MKCSNCGLEVEKGVETCPGCSNDISKQIHIYKESNFELMMSWIAALIPVLVCVGSYILGVVEHSTDGEGADSLLLLFYMLLFGIPISIVAVIFGIKSFIHRPRFLAIISTVLGAIAGIFIYLLLTGRLSS